MIKAKLGSAALALALALAGCGGGTEANLAGNESAPPQLTQIPAPDNGDWSQIVNQSAEGWVMGNPDAPVKLVEYGSLTCPGCRAFSEMATAALRDTYVRSGQVSWEFRHLIIHGAPDVALAMLADCQGTGGFFPSIEQIYDQQPEILNGFDQAEQQQVAALPPEQQLAPLARAMDLDTFFARRGMPESRFSQCLGNMGAAQRLADIYNRAMTQEGVTGTPTFLINGQRQEASSWQQLEPVLRTAIGG